MATYKPPMMARSPFTQGTADVQVPSNAPPGTFLPGTKVQVGSHRVVIDRYLSEGGFAHVYVVTLPNPVDGQEKGVLKRVAVPDKHHLANMRTEVDTMKRLRGHKYIVKYIDSHASSLKAGGYEVFLLMEFCQGGGLIDLMNTRLQNRLTEPEILNIFTDIAEGVACMHYLKPPLLHRDLKIENVLISLSGTSRTYKLCDFGSAAPPRPAAKSTAEGRLIEEDIQQHTTLQYRSPEMIDVYRKHPIDEKSDIWALGCFLYKLCYYTTPFEEVGQMAILNASFKYPGHPKFSDQLKLLIATMLREQPSQRPNIYQVLQKACQMEGRPFKLKDIYTDRTEVEKRRTEVLPEPPNGQSRAGASLAPVKQEASQNIPDIAPMRRGRPVAPISHHNSAKPSPSPLRIIESSDPFAQLDGKTILGGDALSSKFPTLDQFSLMTDKSSRFAFQSEQMKNHNTPPVDASGKSIDVLAEEAFVRPASPVKPKPSTGPVGQSARDLSQPAHPKSLEREGPTSSTAPLPMPKKPAMVSIGTMTSPPAQSPSLLPMSDKPVWKVPNSERSSSTGPVAKLAGTPRSDITSRGSGSRLANLLKQDASHSQEADTTEVRSIGSSRPSMEGGRPALLDLDQSATLGRSRSLNTRQRPLSVNMGAGPTHIKDHELKKSDRKSITRDNERRSSEIANPDFEVNITSDLDFLKAKEEEERERSKNMRRGSSHSRHGKRVSLPSIALAGTKNVLHGRFGEAFKKFESGDERRQQDEAFKREYGNTLSPISGSTATDLADDQGAWDETEDLSPEMRRELEKRQLEAEERRVANAAAEYRQRTSGSAGRPPVPNAKAPSIQNRVQSLLQDSGRPVQRTATGYGQYTETSAPVPPSHQDGVDRPQYSVLPQRAQTVSVTQHDHRSMSAPASQAYPAKMQRPMAPPKPRTLQKNNRAETNSVSTSVGTHSLADPNAADVNGDWEEQFSKRYPSLSHLEMVETEISQR